MCKAVALGLPVLDEFDDTPKDQQYGPVVGKQSSHPLPGKHVQIAEQEEDPEDDQNERSGKRTAVTARRK